MVDGCYSSILDDEDKCKQRLLNFLEQQGEEREEREEGRRGEGRCGDAVSPRFPAGKGGF